MLNFYQLHNYIQNELKKSPLYTWLEYTQSKKRKPKSLLHSVHGDITRVIWSWWTKCNTSCIHHLTFILDYHVTVYKTYIVFLVIENTDIELAHALPGVGQQHPSRTKGCVAQLSGDSGRRRGSSRRTVHILSARGTCVCRRSIHRYL